MNLWGGTRAQSEVIGTILVFSLLVLLVGIWQVTVIPQETKEIEFKHNQEVQDQMRDVQVGIETAGFEGRTRSTTVSLGVNYPARALFLNPGPAAGTIRTVDDSSGGFSITNATALNGETADYWDGDTVRNFDTKSVEYRIKYNRFQNPATIRYENSVLFNRFADGTTIEGEQSLIDGRRIKLTALDGELSTSRVGATTVSSNPISTSRTTVLLTGDGDPITLTINTNLSQEKWETLLGEERSDGYIDSIDCTEHNTENDPCNGTLEIRLTPGETYELQMAKVGLGSNTTEPTAHYLTNLEGGDETITDTQNEKLVVQVRDGFNNPVSGISVPFEIDGTNNGAFKENGETSITVTTDENGRATVTYEPSDLPEEEDETVTVNVGDESPNNNILTPDDLDYEGTTFNLDVIDSATDPTDIGAILNPSSPLHIDSSYTNGDARGGTGLNCENANSCIANVTFENTGNDRITITEIRWFYYTTISTSGNHPKGIPDHVRYVTLSDGQNSDCFDFQGDYETVHKEIGSGMKETFIFNFWNDGDQDPFVEGESFAIAVRYEISGGNERGATFLISPGFDADAASAIPSGSCS